MFCIVFETEMQQFVQLVELQGVCAPYFNATTRSGKCALLKTL